MAAIPYGLTRDLQFCDIYLCGFLCVCLPACISMNYMLAVLEEANKNAEAGGSHEPEVSEVMRDHMGAGTQTQLLWKSSQCS